MGEPVKGTVTSLSSVFPADDAQKASIRVQEAISERQKQVEQLQGFLNDNIALVNLIKKLPDRLHHDIMVPFGKAAFFPGRLIHTNEFLVLLGEGYFAERTSKQTIEILKRRGKNLESQIETLKAVMQDLKFEASFFDSTATEAAEGIVEIREDYVDEASNEDKTITGDEEYAHILSRIDELEKEELESEIAEECETGLSQLISQTSLEPEVNSSEEQKKKVHSTNERPSESQTEQNLSKHFKPEDSMALPVSKDLDLSPATSGLNTIPSITEQDELKDSSHIAPEVPKFASNNSSNSSKAFTGSIVEHGHKIERSEKGKTPAPVSKPVSRFKLQRR